MAHFVTITNMLLTTVTSKFTVSIMFCWRMRIKSHDRLPEGISLEEGALIEPLSVGIHASRRGEVKLGDRVFVFGAGPVGLLTAAAAKAAGASHVVIADISESRLEFAKSYIADETILLTNKPPRNEDTNAFAKLEAEKILENGTEPANVVFDCTGVEVCVQMSIFVSTLIEIDCARRTLNIPMLHSLSRIMEKLY